MLRSVEEWVQGGPARESSKLYIFGDSCHRYMTESHWKWKKKIIPWKYIQSDVSMFLDDGTSFKQPILWNFHIHNHHYERTLKI